MIQKHVKEARELALKMSEAIDSAILNADTEIVFTAFPAVLASLLLAGCKDKEIAQKCLVDICNFTSQLIEKYSKNRNIE